MSGLERALATDTLAEIADSVSNALLNGTGAGAQAHGFLSRIVAPGNPGAEATLSDYINIGAQAVDGIHALAESDISLLLGVPTFKHASSKFVANVDNINALAYLRSQGVTIQTTAKMPAVAAKRQATVLRKGSRPEQSFMATWSAGPEMVRDPYSKADAGTVRVVWHLLWDAYVAVRTAEWSRLKLQVAA